MTIQAPYTNWEPVPLISITDFCLRSQDRQEPDWLEEMREDKLCRQSCLDVRDLDEGELNRYNNTKKAYRTEILKEWPQTLIDSLMPYKKAHIINAKQLQAYRECEKYDFA